MSRILIVDDSAFMRRILKDILINSGYEIAGEAVNGIDAVEKFKELSPDLVLLDLILPVEDGHEALKKMIEIDPNAKVIMCSSMGQQATVIKSIQLGAKDFIVKPFSPQTLADTVKKIIG